MGTPDAWGAAGHAIATGVVCYVTLVTLLRLAGKRTLAHMDEFDLVVTVAVGSMFANVMLNRDTSLLAGAAGIALLVVLQVAVTWAMTRWRGLGRTIQSEPRLLLFRGRLLREAMVEERVNEDELLHAVRARGFGALEDVAAVVLETDGAFSVIPRGTRSLSALGAVLDQAPESDEPDDRAA